jgi:hypothetical protein
MRHQPEQEERSEIEPRIAQPEQRAFPARDARRPASSDAPEETDTMAHVPVTRRQAGRPPTSLRALLYPPESDPAALAAPAAPAARVVADATEQSVGDEGGASDRQKAGKVERPERQGITYKCRKCGLPKKGHTCEGGSVVTSREPELPVLGRPVWPQYVPAPSSSMGTPQADYTAYALTSGGRPAYASAGGYPSGGPPAHVHNEMDGRGQVPSASAAALAGGRHAATDLRGRMAQGGITLTRDERLLSELAGEDILDSPHSQLPSQLHMQHVGPHSNFQPHPHPHPQQQQQRQRSAADGIPAHMRPPTIMGPEDFPAHTSSTIAGQSSSGALRARA